MNSAVVTAEPTIGICLSGGGRLSRRAVRPRRPAVPRRSGRPSASERRLRGLGRVGRHRGARGRVKRAGPHALTAGGFVEHILDPFVTAVTCHDLRRRAVGRWAWQRLRPSGRPRNLVLADVLAEALFPGVERLVDLPERPQLLIAATDLTNGRAFRFSREFMGSWDYGYVPAPPEMRVATAVAASAAGPADGALAAAFDARLGLQAGAGGVDAPRRRCLRQPRHRMVSRLVGGAAATLGRARTGPHRHQRVRPAWPRRASVAQPARAEPDAQDPVRTDASRSRPLAVAELEAGRQQGLYFGIVGDPRRYRLPAPSRAPVDPECYAAALPSRLVGALAALRTDFNRFSVQEAGLLAYHGYHSAHARFASLRPADAVGEPPWRQFAGLGDVDAVRLEDGLRGRRHHGASATDCADAARLGAVGCEDVRVSPPSGGDLHARAQALFELDGLNVAWQQPRDLRMPPPCS